MWFSLYKTVDIRLFTVLIGRHHLSSYSGHVTSNLCDNLNSVKHNNNNNNNNNNNKILLIEKR